MAFDLLLLVGGFGLLIVGGESLVRGSVALAERAGLSPLFIGIALVGFGTSVPELVTSLQASFQGSPGIAVGNFVGSNISNILLIIGTSALLLPLHASLDGLRRDGAIVLGVACLFAAFSAIWPLSRGVGALYICLLLTYLSAAYFFEKRRGKADRSAVVDKADARPLVDDEPELMSENHARYTKRFGWAIPLLMTIAGIATIVLGGKVLVDSAVRLAEAMGISETVIGLTIVAIGTSMPELVTSIVAAFRKVSDVAVGNILGSNIYNTLGIGGVVGAVAPTNVPEQIIHYDNIVVIAATAALIALAVFGKGTIHRIGGAALLAAYCTYIWSVWPAAS